MTTEEITLQVSPAAAQAFRQASVAERLRLETLVSLQLIGELQPRRSLTDVMDDISKQAAERGLTPALLEELLRDDS